MTPRSARCFFTDDDLLSILDHQAGQTAGELTRASETHSLQPGTSAWAAFGLAATDLTIQPAAEEGER